MRSILFALSAFAIASTSAWAQPAPSSSVEAQLCRSQLELLISGSKLTSEEIARFEVQCACLEESEAAADQCTAENGSL